MEKSVSPAVYAAAGGPVISTGLIVIFYVQSILRARKTWAGFFLSIIDLSSA